MNKYLKLVLTLALISCGGGDGSDSDFAVSISGKWSGQLYQNGGVFCSDGAFLGVGSGVPTQVLNIEIEGGDNLNGQVTLDDGLCKYVGIRDLDFTITLIPIKSDCYLDSIEISNIKKDSFDIVTDPLSPIPDKNGQATCVISEIGTLNR